MAGASTMQPKDWVTMVTAAIACALSLINFWRQLRLEKRLLLEPYFQKVWPELSAKLTMHLAYTASWARKVKTGKDSEGYFTLLDTTLSQVELDGDMQRYDKNFTSTFNKYISFPQKLCDQVKAFNKLAEPSLPKLYDLMRLSNVFDEEGRADLEQRRLRATEIARKYLGKVEGVTRSDFTANLAYQRDLAWHEKQVLATAEQLEIAHGQLDRLVKLFSSRFAG